MRDYSASSKLLASYLLAGLTGVAAGIGGLLLGEAQLRAWGLALARGMGSNDTIGLVVSILLLVLGCGVLFLVAILWIGFRGTSEMRTRLSLLADASSAYAAGKLGHRIQMAGDDDLALTANRLNTMAQMLQEQVRALQEAVSDNLQLREDAEVAATIKERERVQRELHDRVSQNLFGLAMLCSTAEAQRIKHPEQALSLLPELKELAKSTQASMRSLLLELRPLQLGERNLVAALRGLTEELAERTGLLISFSYHFAEGDTEPAILNASVEDTLFLIGQEALLNALRHAQARSIVVDLYCERSRALLRVQDDGVGLPKVDAHEGDSRRYTSVGLRSMAERAQLIGGTCTITTRQEGGTEVNAIIPLIGGASL